MEPLLRDCIDEVVVPALGSFGAESLDQLVCHPFGHDLAPRHMIIRSRVGDKLVGRCYDHMIIGSRYDLAMGSLPVHLGFASVCCRLLTGCLNVFSASSSDYTALKRHFYANLRQFASICVDLAPEAGRRAPRRDTTRPWQKKWKSAWDGAQEEGVRLGSRDDTIHTERISSKELTTQ